MESPRITLFEGPAGTGKTTALMSALTERVERDCLADGQRVLALTFMHGARRRLDARLQAIKKLRSRYDCMTIDSFAWQIVCRWRSLVSQFRPRGLDLEVCDYELTCELAATVLNTDAVLNWIFAAHPVLIADEMQDCKSHRLGIIKALSRRLDTLTAADHFQDLSGVEPNEAVRWLNKRGKAIPLSFNHRTRDTALLDGANSIREGHGLRSHGSLRVFSAPNHHVLAHFIATGFAFNGLSNTVILSPSRPENSPLLCKALVKLADSPISPKPLRGREVGPFRVPWESNPNALAEELLTELDLPQGEDSMVDTSRLRSVCDLRGGDELEARIRRHKNLTGKHEIPVRTVRAHVSRVCQILRAFGTGHGRTGAHTMTVHQAKNREFDNVILVWPYRVAPALSQQRRLLYNAITRARHKATIIVQTTPSQARHKTPPFTDES